MIHLEHTERCSRWDKHKTWTKVGDEAARISPLQNQFALHEFHMSEAEALAKFRAWLWSEMQDGYNVVSKAMKELARAYLAGETVEVLVTQSAGHGQLLVNALLWLATHLPPEPNDEIHTAEPAPCYEPMLAEAAVSLRGEIDPKNMVWVTGQTQSKIGVIVGWNEVLVPAHGVLQVKNFEKKVRWVNDKLARSPPLQQALNDELDQLFEQELATSFPYDAAPSFAMVERYKKEDFWAQTPQEELESKLAIAQAEGDSMTQVEQLAAELGDMDTALEVAGVPDVEGWYAKRSLLPTYGDPKLIGTVYKHKGDDSPLMVKSPEDQLAGKKFRYAQKVEMEAYRKIFRPTTGQKTESSTT